MPGRGPPPARARQAVLASSLGMHAWELSRHRRIRSPAPGQPGRNNGVPPFNCYIRAGRGGADSVSRHGATGPCDN